MGYTVFVPAKMLINYNKRLGSTSDGGYWWNRIVRQWAWQKARSVNRLVGSYVEGKKILDIGLGLGVVTDFFKKRGYDVTGVDVVNMSLYDDIEPVIYNGTKIPFGDKSFDTAFLFHVLHHCDEPYKVLAEAVRCAKRVIIIEDTFRSRLGYWRTEVNDCLSNMEFKRHKFNSLADWKKLIKTNGWKLVTGKEWWALSQMIMPTRYSLMVVEGK